MNKALPSECLAGLFVLPKGFEPLSSVPETKILSIQLRERSPAALSAVSGCKSNKKPATNKGVTQDFHHKTFIVS